VKVVLEAANGKLTVYTEPPPHPLKYPCVVLEPTLEGVDYDLDMGDNAWSFVMPLTLTVRSGQANEGWRELMKYLSPTGTESIKAGIRTDTTLNAAVDDSIIEGVRNIGRDPQSEDAVQLFGATFLLRVYESIT
jgi:hypothetical protein